MAKPKFPKKTTGGQEVVSPTTTPSPATTGASVIAGTTPTIHASNPEPRPIEQKAIEQNNIETTKADPRKTARKPEIVKSDSRSNLVPINMDDEIRRLAYLIAERRGFQPGHDAEDWLAAEHEIRQRYHQQSA